MVISKEALEKIKKIVENRYNSLLLTLGGKQILSNKELEELKKMGFNVENTDSLLHLIYYHYILNTPSKLESPLSINEMKKQQMALPDNKIHKIAVEHLNENFASQVDKLKAEVQTNLESLIRNINMSFRNQALQREVKPEEFNRLLKESTIGKIKQELRAYSGDVYRNWDRIAITETSNAIGLGSADRIITQNKDKNPKDIYVYKIVVQDAALCKYCRGFFLDTDGVPSVYRLSTILSNGTNYGKKANSWKAVIGPIHPNCRESGLLELRPGWKVTTGGKLEFIGQEAWEKYIQSKVRS